MLNGLHRFPLRTRFLLAAASAFAAGWGTYHLWARPERQPLYLFGGILLTLWALSGIRRNFQIAGTAALLLWGGAMEFSFRAETAPGVGMLVLGTLLYCGMGAALCFEIAVAPWLAARANGVCAKEAERVLSPEEKRTLLLMLRTPPPPPPSKEGNEA